METTSFTQNRIVNCFSLIHLKELQSALCHCFNTHTSKENKNNIYIIENLGFNTYFTYIGKVLGHGLKVTFKARVFLHKILMKMVIIQ